MECTCTRSNCNLVIQGVHAVCAVCCPNIPSPPPPRPRPLFTQLPALVLADGFIWVPPQHRSQLEGAAFSKVISPPWEGSHLHPVTRWHGGTDTCPFVSVQDNSEELHSSRHACRSAETMLETSSQFNFSLCPILPTSCSLFGTCRSQSLSTWEFNLRQQVIIISLILQCGKTWPREVLDLSTVAEPAGQRQDCAVDVSKSSTSATFFLLNIPVQCSPPPPCALSSMLMDPQH